MDILTEIADKMQGVLNPPSPIGVKLREFDNSPFPLLAKRGLQILYPQWFTDLWIKISLKKEDLRPFA